MSGGIVIRRRAAQFPIELSLVDFENPEEQGALGPPEHTACTKRPAVHLLNGQSSHEPIDALIDIGDIWDT
jgi:hypothetical protein